MKKLLFKSFLFLILLSSHSQAAVDEETKSFRNEWHRLTKISVQARITSFQEQGFNQESAEIFSRFMTLAFPINIEVIANYLCDSNSPFEGLRKFHSAETDKQSIGLAIKAILVYQAPIYIYAYGVLKGFSKDKLKPFVESILEGTNARFQAATTQNITSAINMELFENIFTNQDSIKQTFPTLLGNILKNCCNTQLGAGTIDNSSLQEISSYRFWKRIFNTCDINTSLRAVLGEFLLVRF